MGNPKCITEDCFHSPISILSNYTKGSGRHFRSKLLLECRSTLGRRAKRERERGEKREVKTRQDEKKKNNFASRAGAGYAGSGFGTAQTDLKGDLRILRVVN